MTDKIRFEVLNRIRALVLQGYEAKEINVIVEAEFGVGVDHNLLGRVIASIRRPDPGESRDMFEDEPTLRSYEAVQYVESHDVSLGTSPVQRLHRLFQKGEVVARYDTRRRLRYLKSSLDALIARLRRAA